MVLRTAADVARRVRELGALFERSPKEAREALRHLLDDGLELHPLAEGYRVTWSVRAGALLYANATKPPGGDPGGSEERKTLWVAGARNRGGPTRTSSRWRCGFGSRCRGGVEERREPRSSIPRPEARANLLPYVDLTIRITAPASHLADVVQRAAEIRARDDLGHIA
jgi:hypothetical protein